MRDLGFFLGLWPIVRQQASEADRLYTHMKTTVKARYSSNGARGSQPLFAYIIKRSLDQGRPRPDAIKLGLPAGNVCGHVRLTCVTLRHIRT